MKPYKKTILLALILLVLTILYFFTRKNEQNVLAEHSNDQIPSSEQFIKQDGANLPLPKLVKKNPSSIASKVKQEFDSERIVKENLPEIVFDALENCSENVSKSDDWLKRNQEIDSGCELNKKTRVEIEYHFQIWQVYENGRLVEYYQTYIAREPITLEFTPAGKISEIDLYLQGMSVFKVTLEDNIVVSYVKREDEVQRFFKYNGDPGETRIRILNEGKLKMENILQDMCRYSNHKKTCEAYSELVKFKYMP